MKTISEMTTELSKLSSRHDTFRKIFKTFQQHLNHLNSDTFPVRGITLENKSDETSSLSFIGRLYELKFSSCMIDGAMKGKITVSRILGEKNVKEITSITYNGQSIVDIKPPQGEDPISLNVDNSCVNLALNWLSTEINA